jgi:hypothetical protein
MMRVESFVFCCIAIVKPSEINGCSRPLFNLLAVFYREESLHHTRELLQTEREAVSDLHNKLELASHQTLKARKEKMDVQLILANHAKEVLEYTRFVEREMKKKLGYVIAPSYTMFICKLSSNRK